MEKQKLLSLLHPSVVIQKNILNDLIFTLGFVTHLFVLPVMYNCFRKVWLLFALLREELVTLVGKIQVFGIFKTQCWHLKGGANPLQWHQEPLLLSCIYTNNWVLSTDWWLWGLIKDVLFQLIKYLQRINFSESGLFKLK